MKKQIVLGVVLAALSGPSFADWYLGSVTEVDGSGLPEEVVVIIVSESGCAGPATTWGRYTWKKPLPENNHAAFALFTTAAVSGKRVRINVSGPQTACVIDQAALISY